MDNRWGKESLLLIGMWLQHLFNQVCKLPITPFTSSSFLIDPNPGQIADRELLVYFVDDANASVISKVHQEVEPDLSKGGRTWFLGEQPRISEVYVLPVLKFEDRYPLLGNLCFHEFMHNKLEPFDIHNRGGDGLAIGNCMSAMGGRLTICDEIRSSTPLTEKNKELMAKALTKRVLQYKGAL
jgi:hypothetical protein